MHRDGMKQEKIAVVGSWEHLKKSDKMILELNCKSKYVRLAREI